MKRKIGVLISIFFEKICGRFVDGFLVKNSELKFLVAVNDMSVGRWLRYSGVYGEDELTIISKLVNSQSSVVFIGAHIGALSIPTALRVRDAIFVEANPRTYEFLSANISLNSLNNVTSYNVAIGEKDGAVNFVASVVNSGGSKREPLVQKEMYYYDNPQTISVPLITLDSLLSDPKKNYDLIFMDIEGSEFFALKGMEKTLQRVRSLIIEFIPHHLENVAGVSVANFLAPITFHFDYCYVPL